jgi:hypothetical protein
LSSSCIHHQKFSCLSVKIWNCCCFFSSLVPSSLHRFQRNQRQMWWMQCHECFPYETPEVFICPTTQKSQYKMSRMIKSFILWILKKAFQCHIKLEHKK